MTLLEELKKRIAEIDPEYRVVVLGDDDYDIRFRYGGRLLEAGVLELSKDPDEPEPDTYYVSWLPTESNSWSFFKDSDWSDDPNDLQKLIDQATGETK